MSMTWPWLVVLLLAYAAIGAVVAYVAYMRLWANLLDLGDRNGGLRTVWAWIYCLGLSALIGFAWLFAVPAWAVHQSRTPLTPR